MHSPFHSVVLYPQPSTVFPELEPAIFGSDGTEKNPAVGTTSPLREGTAGDPPHHHNGDEWKHNFAPTRLS